MRRLWPSVVIGIVVGGILLSCLYGVARRVESDQAAQLLYSASASRARTPTAAEAEIRVFSEGVWRQTRADMDYAGELVRLSVGAGSGRSVLLDDGRRVWRLDSSTSAATAIGPSAEAMDWARLRANYRATPVRSQSVGGRPCDGAMLVSRRTGKPALVAWIDRQSQMIGKRLTYDADGHLVASTELIRFAPHPGPTRAEMEVPNDWRRVDPEEGRAVKTTPADFQADAGFTPRLPKYLPQSYTEEGLYRRACPNGCAYAELRYSDGLRVLSIYEHRPCGRGRGGGRGRGCGRGPGCQGGPPDQRPVLIDQGQAKTVRQRRADLVVVVAGDLAVPEILRVVESIR